MRKSTFLAVVALASLLFVSPSLAASKNKINKDVQAALQQFVEVVEGGQGLLNQAKGVLVFPKVTKAGMVFGGEMGDGALLINGKTQGYYRVMAASVGFQLGIQVRSEFILFLDGNSLDNFRNSNGWEIGVDGSVALVELSAGASASNMDLNEPVVAFIISGKGLMYNLTLEGSKINKINPK